MEEIFIIQEEKENKKSYYKKPFMFVEKFTPQAYCSGCQWRATLHCGVYGNRSYREGDHYVYGGGWHGEDCQNTQVIYRKNTDGSFTITGQEVPKGSVVTYVKQPVFTWGTRGVSAPYSPSSNNEGALYSLVEWSSLDVNGTGDYIHVGYVQSWEAFQDGTSNVS